jgi:hypothetical protein
VAPKRPQASPEEVESTIKTIQAYWEAGQQSLRELPERGGYAKGAIKKQASELAWNETKLRKARQFAAEGSGYSQERLQTLFTLLRRHRPVFGTAHIGILITVSWKEGRADIQKRCIQGNWSFAQLGLEVKKRFGARHKAGRRRRLENDPIGLLVQLDEFAGRWERWYELATVQDEESRTTLLKTLPAPVRKQVQTVQEAVQELARIVGKELRAARSRQSA